MWPGQCWLCLRTLLVDRYDVDVQIDPYFGTFNKDTADGILTDFKIPNYRRKAIKANSMTIRSR